MIYIIPHSGLANRIRVIVSGLSFSHKVNHRLTIIWNKDKSLFCRFSDLFEKNEKIIVKKKSFILKLLIKAQNSLLIKKTIGKLYSIDFTLFDSNVKEFVWSTGSNFIDYKKLPFKVKNYFFSTCHEFHFGAAYLKFLSPVKSIQLEIDKNSARFTGKTIGVHIRRTDHLQSIVESPLLAFVAAMKLELMADPGINFYLATDDLKVETLLINKFPGKIISYKKDYSRATVKGIQDAVVDLYSLANTCKIYGSYFSSFSDIASKIGDIPLIVVRKS